MVTIILAKLQVPISQLQTVSVHTSCKLLRREQHSDKCPHLGLLSCDAMHSEAPLHIIDQTEVLASLIDADDIWVNRKHLYF